MGTFLPEVVAPNLRILKPIKNFNFREFLMTDARDGSSRTIRQFHFVAWPEGAEVPHQADHFIDLIGQVS